MESNKNLLEVALAGNVKNTRKMGLMFPKDLDFDTVKHAQETSSAAQR